MPHRRQLLAFCTGSWLAEIGLASASDWPDRPVSLVVPFAPGGVTDIAGRVVAESLTRLLRQPVIVENRSGAAGNIGAEWVTRAKPDGNTLLFATQGVLAMNPLIYTRATFDIERDLRPISLTYETDNVVVVGAASPYRSIADLVQGARAWPGAITMGSSGAGGGSHFYGELFQARAGVRFLHVPYRGAGPALTDLVAGKIDVMFDAMPSSSGFIKGGSLRPLAVTGPRRNVLLPEIPTVLEAGVPDYVAVAWGALMAPSGTPEPVCDRLAATLREALAAPSLSGRMTDLGGRTIPSGAGDVAARIRAEAAVWAALIREGRIMVEQ